MSEFSWKDTYSVRVEEIDRQHKDFLKLINRLNILHSHTSLEDRKIGDHINQKK